MKWTVEKIFTPSVSTPEEDGAGDETYFLDFCWINFEALTDLGNYFHHPVDRTHRQISTGREGSRKESKETYSSECFRVLRAFMILLTSNSSISERRRKAERKFRRTERLRVVGGKNDQ